MTCPIAQISIPKQDQTKNLRKKNGPDLDHHYLFSGRLEYSGQQLLLDGDELHQDHCYGACDIYE